MQSRRFLEKASKPERRSGLSRGTFVREYAKPLKPVILTDAASHWKAMEWTVEYFAREFGDRKFTVDGTECRLAELIELILNSTPGNPAPYLRNVNIGVDFTDLLPDISPPIHHSLPNRLETRMLPQRFLHRGEGRHVQLFIGGAGRAFPNIHVDRPPFHTWSTLVCGRKEWILFSPGDTPCMYPQEGAPDISRVTSVYDPDLERFPLFARASPVRVVQKPGESVFLPSGWWHTAKNLEPSISVASDQLSGTSWPSFTKQVVVDRSDRNYYARAVGVYLATVGAVLSVVESVGIEI